eukprot:TRINITY_DN80647_c0_g1_i1.p1 TRINITY_DN80647_c0_g1~~TRINITY_DN80647_c0_g1_i1.p1  ORF type:complete len:1012 (-),score=231.43 TRINITY_DN80647_c0_g1_i1:75-3110(-)
MRMRSPWHRVRYVYILALGSLVFAADEKELEPVVRVIEVQPDAGQEAWRQHDDSAPIGTTRVIRRQVSPRGETLQPSASSEGQHAGLTPTGTASAFAADLPRAARAASLVEVASEAEATAAGGRQVQQREAHHSQRSNATRDNPLSDEEDEDVSPRRRACGESWYLPMPERCPADCPYVAEEAHPIRGRSCYFRCVAADGCGTNGTRADQAIPDWDTMTCRRCNVAGCRECDGAGRDRCQVCAEGYYLMKDGVCDTAFFLAKPILQLLVCAAALAVLAWYWDLHGRPICNSEGVRQGLLHQAHKATAPAPAPLQHASTAAATDRELYQLGTNIAKDPKVGGPGLSLHMRFQFYVLGWAVVLGLVYAGLGALIAPDLLSVGLMPGASSSVAMCSLIPWSASQAGQLLTVKIAFLAFAYIFTLVSSVIFALSQEVVFQDWSLSSPSLGRFACVLQGLPTVPSSERLEEELAAFVEGQTHCKPVGVCVCWDYGHVQAVVEEHAREVAGEQQQQDQETQAAAKKGDIDEEDVRRPRSAQAIYDIFDALWYRRIWRLAQTPPSRLPCSTVKSIVEGIRNTDAAFVVFASEEQRFAALSRFHKSEDALFRGKRLRMSNLAGDIGPMDILWQNFEELEAVPSRPQKMLKAFALLLVLILGFSVIFYIPFAYYSFAEPFARGDGPTGSAWLLLVVGVLMCNQLLCVVSTELGHSIGFRTAEELQIWRNCARTASLTISCLAFLSFVALVCVSELQRQQQHSGDGRRFSEMHGFQDALEAYPMQRALGSFVFAYSFPSFCLAPCLVDGLFGTAVVPHLTLLLARSDPSLRCRRFAQAFSAWRSLTLDRYSDLVFNATLAVLSLLFAGGYSAWVFVALLASHSCLCAFDHWRILRASASARFEGQAADRVAIATMALPGGLLLACALFHGAVMYAPNVSMSELLPLCLFGFCAHASLHVKLLLEFVPKIAGMQGPRKSYSYEDAAAATAGADWFSANPMHQLRCRYIYGEAPGLQPTESTE